MDNDTLRISILGVLDAARARPELLVALRREPSRVLAAAGVEPTVDDGDEDVTGYAAGGCWSQFTCTADSVFTCILETI